MNRSCARSLIVGIVVAAVTLVLGSSQSRADLVAHWTFDEGGGGTAFDSAGSNDGALVNSPTWTGGMLGGALDFNGTNQYVNSGTPAALQLTGDMTLTAWVKPSSGIVGTRGTVIGKHYNGEYEMDFSHAHNGLMYYHGPNWGNNDGVVGSPVVVDDWYLLTIVRDSTAMTVTGYVQDNATGTMYSNTWTYLEVPPVTTNAVHIGRRTPGGLYWPGLIDDMGVWNDPLAAAEVRSMYTVPTNLGLDYDAGDVTSLWDIYDSAGAGGIKGIPWQYRSSLPGSHAPGDAFVEGGIMYVALGDGTTGLAAVPEPSTLLLSSLGLLGLGLCGWRRRKRQA